MYKIYKLSTFWHFLKREIAMVINIVSNITQKYIKEKKKISD